MNIPFLDLSHQTREVQPQLLERLKTLTSENRFIGGAEVEDFESSFAHFCGAEKCIALNSGTDALRLALLACGIKDGDEVVTSPFTFIATAEAISQTGVPVFADVDLDTFNLSVESVRASLSAKTRAIVPVHIFGLPADMTGFGALAAAERFVVVEDACQAHGAAIGDKKTGSFGNAAAFSFYPSKNLGAFGDAGAVTTSDPECDSSIRLLRNHGQTGPYFHQQEGYNSRMDTMQAAVLNLKLPLLEQWNEERQRLAGIYREVLAGLSEVRFQKIPDGHVHAFHIVAALVEDRSRLMSFLLENGVEVKIVYPIPIHLLPAYSYLGHREGDFPNSEEVARRVLCFPAYPGMGDDRAFEAATLIRRFYTRSRAK
jgi:dTDP-4-amino-4,6-dideoxygalactose transaminase